MPILHITRDAKKSYSTFYTWLQRLEYVPKLCNTFNESLLDGDAVVIINPRKPFKKSEVENFLSYIKNGGKALIIDDPFEEEISTVRQLLSPLGMFIKPIIGRNTALFYRKNEEDSLSFTSRNAGEVEGGKMIMFANISVNNSESRPTFDRFINRSFPHFPVSDFPDQISPIGMRFPKIIFNKIEEADSTKSKSKPTLKKIPVFAVRDYGKGMVGVLACADVFTTAQMCYSGVIPGKNMRNIHEFEYWIFRDLFQLGEN